MPSMTYHHPCFEVHIQVLTDRDTHTCPGHFSVPGLTSSLLDRITAKTLYSVQPLKLDSLVHPCAFTCLGMSTVADRYVREQVWLFAGMSGHHRMSAAAAFQMA